MKRFVLLALPGLSLLLLLASTALAQTPQTPPSTLQAVPAEPRPAAEILEAEARLERRLLAGDLQLYGQARTAEQRERGRVEAAQTQLDQQVTSGTLSIESFEKLDGDIRAARDLARAASERADEIRRRIGERLRRLGAIEEEISRAPRGPDPISGHWRVRVGPADRHGTFDLRLRGTVVNGRYTFDDGSSGSLVGTYSNGTLRLERVDAQAGFDLTYTGTVDAATGRIAGIWQGKELADGRPSTGGWSAARQTRTLGAFE